MIPLIYANQDLYSLYSLHIPDRTWNAYRRKTTEITPTPLQPHMFTRLQSHGHILIRKRVSSPILVRNDSRSAETFRGEQWTWNKRAVKFAIRFLFFSPYTSAMQVFHLCAQWVAEIYRTPTSFPAALAHVRHIKNSNMTPRR